MQQDLLSDPASRFCTILFRITPFFFRYGGLHVRTRKSRVAEYPGDISATRLSHGDPVGFPPHSREWFSIIVYRQVTEEANKKTGLPNIIVIFRQPGCLDETL